MTLVGGLLVMVMFSGYENFVSPVGYLCGQEKLNWLGKMDATSLKNKGGGINSRYFFHSPVTRVCLWTRKTSDNKLMWYVIIHTTFVLSAFVMELYLDRLTRRNREPPSTRRGSRARTLSPAVKQRFFNGGWQIYCGLTQYFLPIYSL